MRPRLSLAPVLPLLSPLPPRESGLMLDAVAKAKPAPLESITDALVEDAARRVREGGAVPIKKLSAKPLSRRAEQMLFEALERQGLERTPKVVRVALGTQLEELVARHRRVELKGLKKRLAGCASDAEAKRTAVEVARAGRARWVVGLAGDALVSPSVEVLNTDEVAGLIELVPRLVKLAKGLKPAKGQPERTLERALLGEILSGVAVGGVVAPVRGSDLDPTAAVVAELAGARESVFVPELARRLAARLPGVDLREVLLAAARAGRVELRPESGIGLLSVEDRALCPSARDGTPLSYVRLSD